MAMPLIVGIIGWAAVEDGVKTAPQVPQD